MGVHEIIFWGLPATGLVLIVAAVWRLCRRRWLVGAVLLGAGLLVAGGCGVIYLSACRMFGPVQGGSDSQTSREAFVRVMGFEPPTGIHDLRYWSEAFTDFTILMRFQFSAQGDIDAIRERFRLVELDSPSRKIWPSPDYPSWWRPDPGATYVLYEQEEPCYVYTYLWVDTTRRVAFLMQFDT